MNDILIKITDFIRKNDMIEKGDRLLLSLSAGKDSMALFHILMALRRKFQFHIAVFHLNHLMRGKESDEDELFVKNLAQHNAVSFHLKRYDFSTSRVKGKSFEEEARDMRYGILRSIASENNYNKIATAHTLDDSVETVLMRIFTGTGIHGLKGIDPRRAPLIRPLLGITGEEVYAFLKQKSIPWREDATNADPAFLRNYVRNELIPVIAEKFPSFRQSIGNLCGFAAENDSLIDSLVAALYGRLAVTADEAVEIDADKIGTDYPLFVHAVSKVIRNNFGLYITKNMMAEIFRKYLVSKSNVALYERGNLVIEKKYESSKSIVRVSTAPKKDSGKDWRYLIPAGPISDMVIRIREIPLSLSLKIVPYDFFMEHRNGGYAFIACDCEKGMLIRNRRPGDRIRLQGYEKKIKELMIDAKLDPEKKRAVPLLLFDAEIAAYLPGLIDAPSNRIAEKYKVTPVSTKILSISRL